jgi:hypothetical protein
MFIFRPTILSLREVLPQKDDVAISFAGIIYLTPCIPLSLKEEGDYGKERLHLS